MEKVGERNFDRSRKRKGGQGEPEEDTEGDGRELGKSVSGSAWFQRKKNQTSRIRWKSLDLQT